MAENVAAAGNGAGRSAAARLLETVSAKERELHQVGRVLHEHVGQILTVVGLHLDVLRQDFGQREPELGARTAEIQHLLNQAIDEVRALTYRVNPDMVQRSGLRYALEALVGGLREKSGKNIRLLVDQHAHLPQAVAAAFYRVADLALDNALRHSGSALVEVVLQPYGVNGARLEVKDHGCGFAPEQAIAAQKGLGILWMRHAAEQAGAVVHIASKQGEGSVVQAVYAGEQAAAPGLRNPGAVRMES